VREGCLGRAVRQVATTGDPAHDRGDADDGSAVAGEQVRQGGLGEGMRGGDVEVESLLEGGDVGLDELPRHPAADVVHQHVEPSERVDGGLRERGHLVEVPQVGGHDDRLASEGLHLGGDLVQLVLSAGGQDDVGTGLGEREGTGGPDSAACSGDDRNPVVEAESLQHHGRTLAQD
jgi:hypothetical protein